MNKNKPLIMKNLVLVLKKAYEADEDPVQDFNATVSFHDNGKILLKVQESTFSNIIDKFYKDWGILQSVELNENKKDELKNLFSSDDPFAALKLNDILSSNRKKTPLYKGDYLIAGITSEGEPFSSLTSFSSLHKEGIILNNVSIGSDLRPNQTIEEVKYLVFDLPIHQEISADFLGVDHGLRIRPIKSIKNYSKNENIHLVEIRIKGPKNLTLEDYDVHFRWILLALSFASGCSIELISRSTLISGDCIRKEAVFWPGRIAVARRDFQVIKKVEDFVCKVSDSINSRIFDGNGMRLGLALSWWLDSFNVGNSIELRFLILCTILETLAEACLLARPTENQRVIDEVKKCFDNKDFKEELQAILSIGEEKNEESFRKKYNECQKSVEKALIKLEKNGALIKTKRQLAEKKVFEKVKSMILDSIKKVEESSFEEQKTKFSIFKGKVEQEFRNNFNKETYEYKVAKLLEMHEVPYVDLFPNKKSNSMPKFEFVDFRNDIVHYGHARNNGLTKLDEQYNKLVSLVIRVFLSILNYKGYYYELQEIEFKSQPSHNIYDRISVPFRLENPS